MEQGNGGGRGGGRVGHGGESYATGEDLQQVSPVTQGGRADQKLAFTPKKAWKYGAW